ncbi:MAG: tetratricopeptide repeat protein [Gammaproteobacteria bacterium]
MPAPPLALLRLARPASVALALLAAVTLAACAHRDADPGAAVATPAAAAPVSAEAALTRGEDAYAKEDWAGAETAFLAAAQAARGDAEPWFKLGNVYFRTARYDFAAQAYEQCLRRAPGHAKAWHNLGVVRLHQADQSFERVSKGSEPHDAALDDRARRLRDILDDAIGPEPASP